MGQPVILGARQGKCSTGPLERELPQQTGLPWEGDEYRRFLFLIHVSIQLDVCVGALHSFSGDHPTKDECRSYSVTPERVDLHSGVRSDVFGLSNRAVRLRSFSLLPHPAVFQTGLGITDVRPR